MIEWKVDLLLFALLSHSHQNSRHSLAQKRHHDTHFSSRLRFTIQPVQPLGAHSLTELLEGNLHVENWVFKFQIIDLET